jgi:hypothetical protein
MNDAEKLARIEDAVGFMRHFCQNNAGVEALCNSIAAILNGDEPTEHAVMDDQLTRPTDSAAAAPWTHAHTPAAASALVADHCASSA